MHKLLNTIILLTLLTTLSAQEVTLSFGQVDDNILEILIESEIDVYGFQFDLTGVTISDFEAGSIVPSDWMVTASDFRVLGFSLMGTYIPAGSGILGTITYESSDGDICIENGVVSGNGGVGLEVGYGDCVDGGDDDVQVALGFGTVDESAGTMEILMDNSEDVYGFQFNVAGLNIISAEAGGVVPGDWMLSASNDLVLGFSLMGTDIPSGSGVLVNIVYEGTGGDICLENAVVSGSGGTSQHSTVAPSPLQTPHTSIPAEPKH